MKKLTGNITRRKLESWLASHYPTLRLVRFGNHQRGYGKIEGHLNGGLGMVNVCVGRSWRDVAKHLGALEEHTP